MGTGVAPSARREEAILWIGPPPTHSNSPPPDELEQIAAIARTYDVAERDARNRALGRAGEERILAHEHATLLVSGRTDLAERIRWGSDVDGDGAGYDIRSFDTDGSDRLIEVKTTNAGSARRFTSRATSLRSPRPTAINGGSCGCGISLGSRERSNCGRHWRWHVSLMATSYQASFL